MKKILRKVKDFSMELWRSIRMRVYPGPSVPIMKVAVHLLVKNAPDKADSISAALRHVAKELKREKDLESFQSIEMVLRKTLSDIKKNDNEYTSALSTFISIFRETIQEYKVYDVGILFEMIAEEARKI